MAERTGIGWTNKTWNPWQGCTRVDACCDHCYMIEQKKQYGQDGLTVVRSKTTFDAPLRWREPSLIFTCSWSDWFHVDADPWRDEAWDVIRRTPWHTYQILTKRPGRILHHLPRDWAPWWSVWLGVSAGTRQGLARLDVLRDVPAGVRFVSFEPLLEDLGPVNLTGIQWAILGGESGPKHRHCEVAWMQSLADQCHEQGVRVFVKQDMGPRPGMQGRLPDALWALKEMPA